MVSSSEIATEVSLMWYMFGRSRSLAEDWLMRGVYLSSASVDYWSRVERRLTNG